MFRKVTVTVDVMFYVFYHKYVTYVNINVYVKRIPYSMN